MKAKRRRLASITHAIVHLGMPGRAPAPMTGTWCPEHGAWNDGCPAPPSPVTQPPLVGPPRCVSGGDEPCGHCHYCRVAVEGPLYWVKARR